MNTAQIIFGYEFRVGYGVIVENGGSRDPLNPLKILVDILMLNLHSEDAIY